jgi:hypothetical protein
MVSRCKQPARFALATWRERRFIRFRAQQRLRQLQGEPPFSNSRRTDEQIRARQPPRLQRPAEARYNLVVTVDVLPHEFS